MAPSYNIGPVPVSGRVSLAPMDGITDLPFRLICRRMGSSLSISEFINAADVPKKLKDYSIRTTFTNFERPFGYQIYGAQSSSLSLAAKILEKRQPDFIDLNLGCSVRRVAGRGAGAGLLKNPKKISKILRILINAVTVPITVKIRLGWDAEHLNYIEIAKIIEGEGGALITVHARRRDQSYQDHANWKAIEEIKNNVSIPVIGNGDISSSKEIERMLLETGCDGVMVGRASLGNPWIFSDKKKADLSRQEIFSIIQKHWTLMLAVFDAESAAIRFKKHLKAYLSCPQFSNLDLSVLLRKKNPMNDLINKYPYKPVSNSAW